MQLKEAEEREENSKKMYDRMFKAIEDSKSKPFKGLGQKIVSSHYYVCTQAHVHFCVSTNIEISSLILNTVYD